MEFTARLENFNTKLWTYHIKVPGPVADHFLETGNRRVICRLNDDFEFQCALMPAGNGVYFININKKIRTQLGLKEGGKIDVHLSPDDSEFGMPFPEEFREVLKQDKQANQYFEKLTPGKKRNLIYITAQAKNPDACIHRSIIIATHLKNNAGKIDFRSLTRELQAKP
jgi:hypothetical protein